MRKTINRFGRLLLVAGLAVIAANAQAQEEGQFSGDLQLNASLYDYDSAIGTNTTQYFHEKSSAEAWLFLNYRIKGFTLSARYDLYNNSPLLNPQEAYTKQGLGFYSLSKQYKNWGFTVGNFYDQIGSGIIFRAYEERTLGLDYAIQGVRVQYSTPGDSFMIKGFTGQQKYRFDVRPPVIKGANVEKIWGIGPIGFHTGVGLINRTLDQATMNALADEINSRPLENRFVPKYNVFAGTLYNTLLIKNISLYTEYAKKTKEAVIITKEDGSQELVNSDGDVMYAGLNYSLKGFGINLQYKKTNTFILRTSPYENLLNGVMNFLPPLSKQHSFRLPARYSISAIPQGETGYQAEVTYSFNKRNSFNGNFSHIEQPNGRELFREYYLDWDTKLNKNLKAILGMQVLHYDQEVYEFKPSAPPVETLTPFLEWSYRFNKGIKQPYAKEGATLLRPSLRMELQYLKTEEDLGDFAFALLELNLAPKYSVSVSDMVNTKPATGQDQVHYYNFFVSYTEHQTRLSLAYVKQVQGVVCTGGVCRVEPAFSGLRFGLTTNF